MMRFPYFLVVMLVSSLAWADDPPASESPAPGAEETSEDVKPLSPAEQLKADPNSRDAMNAYMSTSLQRIIALMNTNVDEAEKQLDAMAELLGSLEPDDESAKRLLASAVRAVDSYKGRLEIARVSMEELEASLTENPDDVKKISTYIAKAQQEAGPLARSEPKQADEILKGAKEFLAGVKEKAESEEAKKACEGAERAFARLESSIASGLKLLELIGSDAAPLDVEGWVNGTPMTDADLKGKVVVLDFWAIWCGPCVSTFPHLIEWHEKFADKGLVIVGLTRYYKYAWDEESGQVKRSSEPVTPEQEQEAMAKYAESKGLLHRIAFQKDRSLSDYYAVTGIPHVVVIDREGKVRLIRVGSGEKNAQDIEAMIEELIGDAPA
jgi:thiol-disulfide isomerase/thioredoxin